MKPSKVSQPPPKTPDTALGTATFTPYYWEAYNQIVQPQRFNHYLIRRWLPTLGSLGFALVQVLRDRCFYNRQTGVLRDSVELDLDELAQSLGVSRSTIKRELANNETLGQFVQKVSQYQRVGNTVQQRANLYRVSMDEPIHPDDLEEYETLRALKEQERGTPLPTKIVHPDPRARAQAAAAPASELATKAPTASQNILEGHFDPQGKQEHSYEVQNDLHNADQNEPHYEGHFEPLIDKLPSGGVITKELITPQGAVPPINSPQGERGDSPEAALWSSCLTELEALTDENGKLLINKPSFETHIRPLRVASMVLEEGKVGRVQLFSISAWSVEWIGKRYAGQIEEILSEKLGRLVQISLEVPK